MPSARKSEFGEPGEANLLINHFALALPPQRSVQLLVRQSFAFNISPFPGTTDLLSGQASPKDQESAQNEGIL